MQRAGRNVWIFMAAILSPRASILAPSGAKIARRFSPVWKLKREPRVLQPRGNNSPALKNKLSFAAEKKRSNFEHPFCRGKSKRHSPGFPEGLHELGIYHRMWRREIDRPVQLFMLDEPQDCPCQVLIVNPGQELF